MRKIGLNLENLVGQGYDGAFLVSALARTVSAGQEKASGCHYDYYGYDYCHQYYNYYGCYYRY